MASTQLTLTISLEDNDIDIDIEGYKLVGEVIRLALSAFGFQDDCDRCYLQGPGRLYFPYQRLDDTKMVDGTYLTLRLPQ